ncbi:RNA 2'-phosphotransferase [Paludisphaera soli]|uniref:RNA 2'-phosphotransferase n=1 Tax=Paludisphaera soli TaxID=2712865 RepID=UPI0013ED954B|nr:RNA 2'-phosphotransferase [Paludisphaera soli]
MDPRLVPISKFLAKHLRHAPGEIGLTLDGEGWAGVDELLAASARHGFAIAYDDLVAVVETNDKRRYAFDATGDRIRAVQGHSVAVDLGLEPREPPETLWHGTVERFLTSIFERGLVPGTRRHVHLSADVETARKVGARRGRPAILQVAAGRMHRDGLTFYRSENGVWLVDAVPSGYLSRMG